jgi:hypothetical protein
MRSIVIVAALLLVASRASGQTCANALAMVNQQRAARGLYPLQPNAALQRAAEYESTVRASRRISGHLPNGCSPGVAEGVGMRSGRDPYGRNFLTCFNAPGDFTRRYRYAGAAAAVSPRGGTYYTLILR